MSEQPKMIIDEDSTSWHLNDKLHRIGGPAVIYANGYKYWYQYGKRHRIDGPAVEYPDGDKEWWINGLQIPEHLLPWYFTTIFIKDVTSLAK